MLWFILIVPGLVCLYAMILRPLLRKIPAFQKFYAESDGFWAKVWAMCGRSMTVLWGYILGGIGASFSLVDQIGSALGDPNMNLKQQITDTLKDHPEYLGYALTGISVVTIIARIRSMGKST
jgi:cytochrome bd-type quinol oxidase subunit 2